jgi:hypothetical protein
MRKVLNNSERGAAGIKLLLVLAVLILIANAGYNYIPIAYQGESFKQDMQTAVVQGMAVPPGVTVTDMVKGKLKRALLSNDIPHDAFVEVKPINNAVQARVVYTKKVPILPFGIYTYKYHFDNTATPTGFLMKD